ncbi:MAG TPA: type II toxin-antitoxin system VapC family toxin [Acidimicrobiales bacterium]
MIVLDASAAVDLLLRLGAVASIEGRLLRQGETLHVPYIFDVEVLQVFRRRALRRELTGPRSPEALEDFAALDVVRYPHLPLMERIWTLRSNVSAFDAAYLALAEALDAPVVTADAKLARAPGHRARIELYAL